MDENQHFYQSYLAVAKTHGYTEEQLQPIIKKLAQFVQEQQQNPYLFPPFHKRLREPIDYYQFGLDFMRPLIDWPQSRLEGKASLEKIASQIAHKENVILLANHQIEADPQVISLFLEKEYPHLAEEMVFVAGHRVTTDPLAIPFSLGRNLICIYSKRHLHHDPKTRVEKTAHNQRSIRRLSELLEEGGYCIYVAPSGGRDRPDTTGELLPAPFDPQSIELFLLLARQARTPTHFYPLALFTYPLLPPPDAVQKNLGEQRLVGTSPAHLFFGEEVDLQALTADISDKKEARTTRAQKLWEKVAILYSYLYK